MGFFQVQAPRNFENLFTAIRNECGFENIPTALINEAIPLLRVAHVPLVMEIFAYFSPELMATDAGDIYDERYNLYIAVYRLLTTTSEPIEEALLLQLPAALPFAQRLICQIIIERAYLPALEMANSLLNSIPDEDELGADEEE
jgi:hypothetical protein